jgi:hypothetical protein
MPTSKKKKRPSQQEAKRRETEALFPYPCPPISPSRGPALLAALANLPSRDRPSRGRRRGRPRKIGFVYKSVALYRKKTNLSWRQVARKFFPKDYAEDPNRCTERVRAGVRRMNGSR